MTDWTEQSVLVVIRRMAKKLRKRPTPQQLHAKYGIPFQSHLLRAFGSTKKAIDKANVEDLLASLPPRPPTPKPITFGFDFWPDTQGTRVRFSVDAEGRIRSAWRREGKKKIHGPTNIDDDRTLFWAANPPHQHLAMSWFVEHGHDVLEHDALEEPSRTTRLADDAALFGYAAHPPPGTPVDLIGLSPRPPLQREPSRRLARDKLSSMDDERGAQLTRDMLDEAPEMDWL